MSFNRYKYNEEVRSDAGARIYNTSLLPIIPKQEDDIYIYSQYGDRLDILAYEYWGDASLWPVIATINNVGKGALFVEPGIQLRIPKTPDAFITAMRIQMKDR